MRENKVLKDYLKQKYDPEKNYQSILQKVKKKKHQKRRIINVAASVLVIFALGLAAPSIYAQIQWHIEYKEYENRDVNYGSASIQEAEKEYKQNIEMDYVSKDEIGIKIDSLMITNDYLKAEVNFSLPEDLEINTDTFRFGYAIYDEDNNIYGIQERMTFTEEKNQTPYWKKLYKELDVDYDKKNVFAVQIHDSQGMGVIKAQRGNILSYIQMTSNQGFPKSKKLYLRIFDIGYDLMEFNEEKTQMIATKNVTITDSEWNIELDIPEEFYTRETIELKVDDQVDGLSLNKAEISETGLVLKVELEGLPELVQAGKDMDTEEWIKQVNEKIHIEDGNKNVYHYNNLGTTENEGEVQLKFDLNKKDLENKLYLNIQIDGKEYLLELKKN